jgi:tetratricopeptide (TPR) repeat protein
MRTGIKRYYPYALLAVFALLMGPAQVPGAQDINDATKIYQSCSQSVLLLIVKAENGEKVGQATGFVIDGGIIVTNEHVIRKGKVFVESGVALVPTSIKTSDAFNDLALLEPGIELAVNPLSISKTAPSPGNPVFTISNPAGLEKSISTGVVSNIREFDGRWLIQITAPISYGSSGGPVLNERGEVVGIAVAILSEGQNLNFAVPAEKLVDLLSGKSIDGRDTLSILSEVEGLKADLLSLEYSRDKESDYQKTLERIRVSLQTALDKAGQSAPLLLKVSDMSLGYAADISISAADKAVSIEPSFDMKFMLGKALRSSRWAGGDKSRGQESLKRAEIVFRDCLKIAKKPNPDPLYELADVLENQESYIEAERYFTEALELYKAENSMQGHAKSIRGLIRTSYAQGKSEAGNLWFKTLADLGYAIAWDWQAQGSRLEDVNNFHQAGLSYMQAAELGEEWMWTNWLDAARMFMASVADYDSALYCARKCVTAGSGVKDSEETLGFSHRLIATVLNVRGVYQEALNHAHESIALNAEDPWAYYAQSEALLGLQRYLESANVSQQAIRLSDGKYSTMHFKLGAAYFKLENWELSQQSFKKAAETDLKDTAAPYNVALCMERLRYYRDAVNWYEEVLRRDPKHPDRQDILRRIENLRRTS